MATTIFREDIGAILLSLLECPHCQIICSQPIFMCQNGHNICVSCQCVLTECPVCHCQGRPVIRNHFAEEISLNAQVPCKNADQGCTDICKVKQMPAHLKICEHGFKCLFDRCQWRGSVPNLADHVRNVHADNYFECSDTGSSLKISDSDCDSHLELSVSAKMAEFEDKDDVNKVMANQYTTSVICFKDHIFWYLAEISERSKFNVQLRFIGSVLGEVSLSTAFLYQFEFHSVDGTRTLTYNNKVRSLENPPYVDTVFGDNLTLEPFLEDDALMFTLSMSLACEAITPKKRVPITTTGSSFVNGSGKGGWDALKYRDTEWGVDCLMAKVDGKQDSDSEQAFFDPDDLA